MTSSTNITLNDQWIQWIQFAKWQFGDRQIPMRNLRPVSWYYIIRKEAELVGHLFHMAIFSMKKIMAKIVGIIMCPMNWSQFLIPCNSIGKPRNCFSEKVIFFGSKSVITWPFSWTMNWRTEESGASYGDFLKYIWGALVLIHNLNMLFGIFHEINQSFWEIPPISGNRITVDPWWSMLIPQHFSCDSQHLKAQRRQNIWRRSQRDSATARQRDSARTAQ